MLVAFFLSLVQILWLMSHALSTAIERNFRTRTPRAAISTHTVQCTALAYWLSLIGLARGTETRTAHICTYTQWPARVCTILYLYVSTFLFLFIVSHILVDIKVVYRKFIYIYINIYLFIYICQYVIGTRGYYVPPA